MNISITNIGFNLMTVAPNDSYTRDTGYAGKQQHPGQQYRVHQREHVCARERVGVRCVAKSVPHTETT